MMVDAVVASVYVREECYLAPVVAVVLDVKQIDGYKVEVSSVPVKLLVETLNAEAVVAKLFSLSVLGHTAGFEWIYPFNCGGAPAGIC